MLHGFRSKADEVGLHLASGVREEFDFSAELTGEALDEFKPHRIFSCDFEVIRKTVAIVANHKAHGSGDDSSRYVNCAGSIAGEAVLEAV